jgi:hypothetical protein
MRLQDQMRRMRHLSVREQTDCLNQMLRGHYAYYGIAGNTGVATGPSGRGTLLAQDAEQPELARARLVEAIPADPGAVSLLRPKLYLPYSELQAIAAL